MAKVTVEQLMSKMANPQIDETELAEYFIVDEAESRAFAPRLKLNPSTVQIPRGAEAGQRTAAMMNSANWLARMRRKGQFSEMLAKGYDGPIIVSEGDSWFQYPVILRDTIDHLLGRYAIYSLGAAGDLLKHMADRREYLPALKETGAEILLLSGGGNDLMAGGFLAAHLEEFDPNLSPEDYLLPSFQALLDEALGHYSRMFRQVHQFFPHVSILCHGYDYPVPNKDRWLGNPMESRGIRDRGLQKAIAAVMMDHFNRRLRRLGKSMPHVTYIDCRGTVGDSRWHDGLHPTSAGFGDVARKFAREIQRIANAHSSPPVVIGGPFGSATEISRALQAPLVVAGGRPKGLSLHVGLNMVDPDHYDGWDGQLAACEADAHAMHGIAVSEGFEATVLRTRDATRANVIAEIERAAATLEGGDMFFFTVSAHGGRIPDFNQDEDQDDDANRMDETLCLYDFQLADDELYMLWTKFRSGVRVLMVPDTCHSGSMVKFGPTAPPMLFGRPMDTGPKPRFMPRHIEDRVWRANEGEYREASNSYGAIKESVMTNPLSTPIQASILNLGACKDEQFAMDGAQNGAFTGALMQVWDNGRFAGDYRTFRTDIDARIGSPSQTPQLFEKLLSDPEFVLDRPFSLQPEVRPTGQGSATTGAIHAAPPAVPTSEEEGEGEERDQLSEAEVDAIFQIKSRGMGYRHAQIALAWPDHAEFDAFMKTLGLKNFATDEFLVLGGAHNRPGGLGAGLNTPPPRHLWTRIAQTARVLDHLRDRLGKPIAITNAYRAPAYNTCIGGAPGSQHMEFTALDFTVLGMPATEVATALRWLRDKEGFFKGGIGRYNSFTHVDTRGNNTTWPRSFRDESLPSSSPLLDRAPRDLIERIAALHTVELAAPRQRRAQPAMPSAFSDPARRSGGAFDPSSEVGAHQQSLKAAVNASSVISFVDNLTPGQKEDVLLSTLFAQRAADAKADPVKERAAWYDTYMKMLSLMGWVRQDAPFEASQKMKGNGSFDQVILATLAQVATGNQFAIVESAIKALKGLAKSDGKIELFDFETSSTTGGNFQIGSAENSGDLVSLALGAFNFSFKDRKQNILFVSWGKNELDYWLSAHKLSLSPTIYGAVREIVASKLADTRKSLIADIDIG